MTRKRIKDQNGEYVLYETRKKPIFPGVFTCKLCTKVRLKIDRRLKDKCTFCHPD